MIYLGILSTYCIFYTMKQNKSSRKQIMASVKLKAAFLEYYAKLPIQKLAAEFIGKDEDTIIRWKNKDRKFADRLASAKSAWALENASMVKSKEWLLERIMKEHFSEKKEVEIGASGKIEEALDRLAAMIP